MDALSNLKIALEKQPSEKEHTLPTAHHRIPNKTWNIPANTKKGGIFSAG